MKVFDFDNTLYRGESSLDFSLYMIRTHKKILLYLPVIMANAISYKLCLVDKDKLGAEISKYMKLIIRDKHEIRHLVKTFWQTHANRLDADMLKRIGPNDLIITAGPDFLLDGIRDRLGTPRPDRDPSLQLQGQQSQQIQGTVRRREDRRFLHRFL